MDKTRIIVVEDNIVYCEFVCNLLTHEGFRTVQAFHLSTAKKLLQQAKEEDIIVSDLRLPDGDGIDLLRWMRKEGMMQAFIIMTDYAEVHTAVESMKLGSLDYIPKQLVEDKLVPLLRTLLKERSIGRNRMPLFSRDGSAFQAIMKRIRLVAPTDMSVLIFGENGTGKEHIAHQLHDKSKRSGKPFVAMEERQENRSRAMQELGDMFDREVAETDNGRDFDLANPGGTEENVKSAPKTIQSSAAAYRDLNATLGNFYEQPKNDNADMDELLERIASLESELESEKGKASAMDDQVALMEKSYELAAKYMGGQNGTQPPVGQAAEPYPVQKAGKNTAAPVRQVTHQVVSSLSQPMSNAEFVASFSQERNRSFNTAVGVTTVSDKNTISACVYGAQSVTDGQAVKLRLLEPMAVADKIIPRNAVVVGTAKIQGERLDIEITSLEYAGTIIPVELEVYDTDGQPGIFIPNSMEMNAVREVAANMGGSLGSSINISTNAGAQLASDLGKGLIQGTSQYIAKKMRTVKVHLKAGYKVMLYQDRD